MYDGANNTAIPRVRHCDIHTVLFDRSCERRNPQNK